MLVHGKHRARGGTYCNAKIFRFASDAMDKEFTHARIKCFRCKGPWEWGHKCAGMLETTVV